MKTYLNKTVLFIVIGVVALGGGLWWFLSRHNTPTVAASEPAQKDKKILYWYDPMVPNQHFDKPGKSPFMDMQLMPKYDEPQQSADTVSIDPRTVQNMAVRTAKVERGPLAQRVDTVGYVRVDERKIHVVQSRVQGWIERLNINAANDPVAKGQLLMELYSPDLLAAQEEYLLVRNSPQKHETENDLLAAAKQKMRLLGIAPAQIEQLERSGRASERVAFYAPVNGIVTELGVRQGMQVNPGANLFSIVDLSSVWVTAEVPEGQAAWIRQGNRAEVTAPAVGKVYRGTVNYVYPQVSASSRTLQVRIRLDNPGNRLKPDMFASVAVFNDAKRDALLIPNEAIIVTGRRTVAIVADGEGKFRPVDVKVGVESGNRTEIVSGLTAGQTVVTSGQFLIDSESNARAGFERFEPPQQTPIGNVNKTDRDKPPQTEKAGAQKPTANADTHRGEGKINSIDAAAGKINLSHGPIPTLNWPAMTMDFPVADKKMLADVKPGETVAFDLVQKPGGEILITRIVPNGK